MRLGPEVVFCRVARCAFHTMSESLAKVRRRHQMEVRQFAQEAKFMLAGKAKKDPEAIARVAAREAEMTVRSFVCSPMCVAVCACV